MHQDAAKVFISYAHEDESWRKDLNKHLKGLERQKLIKTWHDREITAGSEWKREIDTHLESADIVLLLISADFINSDYCFDVEMSRALERHDAEEAKVIAIILRDCDWKSLSFARLQALPESGSIAAANKKDTAFTEVAEGIRNLINELREISSESSLYIQNSQDGADKEKVDSAPKDILFLSANPKSIDREKRDREISSVNRAIDNATTKRMKAGSEPFYNLLSTQPVALDSSISQLLIASEPVVIHISGAENGIASLIAESSDNDETEGLDKLVADLFRINTSETLCVVLNGCCLQSQARAIVEHVDFVIGIEQYLVEEMATIYLNEFYFRVALGKDIENAHEAGCHRLLSLKVDCQKMPALWSRKKEIYHRALEESLLSLEGEIQKNPDDALRWKQKGSLLQRLHRSQAASEAYERASSLDPRNPKIREDQGDELRQSGAYEEASSAYDKASELSEEKDYRILWKEGKSQARAEQYNEAINSYSKALKLNPPSPDNYLICREYGCVFEKAGMYKEGLAMYTRALKIQPRYRAASYERKRLYQKIHSGKS